MLSHNIYIYSTIVCNNRDGISMFENSVTYKLSNKFKTNLSQIFKQFCINKYTNNVQ